MKNVSFSKDWYPKYFSVRDIGFLILKNFQSGKVHAKKNVSTIYPSNPEHVLPFKREMYTAICTDSLTQRYAIIWMPQLNIVAILRFV